MYALKRFISLPSIDFSSPVLTSSSVHKGRGEALGARTQTIGLPSLSVRATSMDKGVRMVDKSKIIQGVVTLGLIIGFFYQVYRFGEKLSKKSTGTLESLTLETSVQYPSIAVCPRPYVKFPYNGTKFPTPEEYNDIGLLDFKFCKHDEGLQDMLRNRIIFTEYGSFKSCVLFDPLSKCKDGNTQKVCHQCFRS